MGVYSHFLIAGPPEGNAAWIERFVSGNATAFEELKAHPEWLNEDAFREQLMKRVRLTENPALYGQLSGSIIDVEEPHFKTIDDIFSLALTTPEFKKAGISSLNTFFSRGESIAGTRARILREMLQFDPRNKTYLSAWILSDKLTLNNEDLHSALDGSAIDLSREFDQKAVEELLAKFPQSENASVMSEWIAKTFIVRENKMDSKLLALMKRHPHLFKLKSLQAKFQQLTKPNAEDRKKLVSAYEAAQKSVTAGLSENDLRNAFFHLVPEVFQAKGDSVAALKAALLLDHHDKLDPILNDWDANKDLLLNTFSDPEVAAHVSKQLMRINPNSDNALRTLRGKLIAIIAKKDFLLSEDNPISRAIKSTEFMDTLHENAFSDPVSVREVLEDKLGVTSGTVWRKALVYLHEYGPKDERAKRRCAASVLSGPPSSKRQSSP